MRHFQDFAKRNLEDDASIKTLFGAKRRKKHFHTTPKSYVGSDLPMRQHLMASTGISGMHHSVPPKIVRQQAGQNQDQADNGFARAVV